MPAFLGGSTVGGAVNKTANKIPGIGKTLGTVLWPVPVKWALVRVDEPAAGLTIEGQFRAEDYTESVSTTWEDMAIPQRREPVLQWLHGDAEEATFTTKLWAETAIDEVDSKVRLIKGAVAPDPTLHRPPLWRFQMGPNFDFDCVVRGVGRVQYTELWSDGRVKGVTFELTLRKVFDLLSLAPLDPSQLPRKSLHKPVVRGGTYESIAGMFYGDPRVGILIRHESTEAFPPPGRFVALPEREYYRRRPIAPQAYALGNRAAPLAARRELAARYEYGTELPWVA